MSERVELESSTEHVASKKWKVIKRFRWPLYFVLVLSTLAPSKPYEIPIRPNIPRPTQTVSINSLCPDDFVYTDYSNFPFPGHDIWKRAGFWDSLQDKCVYDFKDLNKSLPQPIRTPITRIAI